MTLRGRRPTLRGVLGVAASAASVFVLSTIAVVAPAWALVWTVAGLVGFAAGLYQPVPPRRGATA